MERVLNTNEAPHRAGTLPRSMWLPTLSFSVMLLASCASEEQPVQAAALALSQCPGGGVCGGEAGTLAGELQVTAAGEASYEIDIEVPPGIQGVQPNLTLDYESGRGNGVAGVGWRLNGLSEIHRCPATLATDGVRGAVRF